MTYRDRAIRKTVDLLQLLDADTAWKMIKLSPSPGLVRNGVGPPGRNELQNRLSLNPLQVSKTRLSDYVDALMNKQRGEKHTPYLLVTDGQLPGLTPPVSNRPGMTVLPVGGASPNVAVTEGRIQRNWKGVPNRMRIRLQNFSDQERKFPLRLHSFTREAVEVSMAAGETKWLGFPINTANKEAERMGVVVDANDEFLQDNAVYAYRSQPRTYPVHLEVEPESRPFIRMLMKSLGEPFQLLDKNNGVEERRESVQKPAISIRSGGDVDRGPVRLGAVFFTRTAGKEGSGTVVETPRNIELNESVDLVKNLSFGELQVERSRVLVPNEHETGLISCDSGWIALRGTSPDGTSYLRFGFSLAESNLMILPEFPILIRNALKWFIREQGPETSEMMRVGTRLSLPPDASVFQRRWLKLDGTVEVQRNDPEGTRDSRELNEPGWYEVDTSGDKARHRAVNFFFPEESKMNRTLRSSEDAWDRIRSRFQSKSTVPLRSVFLYLALASLIVYWGTRFVNRRR